MYTFAVHRIFEYQDIVLKKVAEKLEPFYLAGGTALAKFYFKHRESYDLDFFSKEFSFGRVEEIMATILSKTGKTIRLAGTQRTKQFAKYCMYYLNIDKNESLKIEFVEDVLPLKQPFNRVNGINILSLDDIYLRKIYAISGVGFGKDKIGKKKFAGGRREAKDLFDLYHLSITYEHISTFARKHCESWMLEGLIAWYGKFDRMEMKIGLSELMVTNRIEFAEIDKHFRKEINELIAGLL